MSTIEEQYSRLADKIKTSSPKVVWENQKYVGCQILSISLPYCDCRLAAALYDPIKAPVKFPEPYYSSKIMNVYWTEVDKALRGKGIGQKLMIEAGRQAVSRGARFLYGYPVTRAAVINLGKSFSKENMEFFSVTSYFGQKSEKIETTFEAVLKNLLDCYVMVNLSKERGLKERAGEAGFEPASPAQAGMLPH